MADLMPLELKNHQPPRPTPVQQQVTSNRPPATAPISITLDLFLGGSGSALAGTDPPAVNDAPHLGHLTLLPSATGALALRTALHAGQVSDGMVTPSNMYY